MPNKRVDWTLDEVSRVFNAFKEVARQDKITLPPTNAQELTAFMKTLRRAEITLEENRRRTLANIDSVGGELRKKLVEGGFLPKDVKPLKKRMKKGEEVEQDPDQLRINQLADERDEALKLATEADDKIKALTAENEQLRRRIASTPDEADTVKQFVADILIRARGLAGPKMEQIPVPPVPVKEESHKKHDPTYEPEVKPNRPSIVLVGAKANARHKFIKEFQERASLRFWHSDTENIFQLDAILPRADMVFAHLNDVGHEAIEHVLKAGKPLQRVSGADSSMMDQINNYLERRKREGESKM